MQSDTRPVGSGHRIKTCASSPIPVKRRRGRAGGPTVFQERNSRDEMPTPSIPPCRAALILIPSFTDLHFPLEGEGKPGTSLYRRCSGQGHFFSIGRLMCAGVLVLCRLIICIIGISCQEIQWGIFRVVLCVYLPLPPALPGLQLSRDLRAITVAAPLLRFSLTTTL